MKTLAKRSISITLSIMLCISLLLSVSITTSAATVDYVYSGDYIKNWGTREEVATFLSPNAEAFYKNNGTSYAELSKLSGSSSTSNVHYSDLYEELQNLMESNHDYETSYNATRSLFQYTDCQNSGKTSNKISSFYSGALVGPSWDGGSTWNREHTWPNSKGDTSGNGENDIMMLRPTSVSENSSRGNKAYGEGSSYYHPNEESNDKYDLRGDVARIILYQYVRWNCTNTGSEYNPNSIFGTDGVIESKAVMLEWIEADPVDTWELGRNDAVESITGTRNVFVDYPELAFILFGEQVPSFTTPSGEAKGTCTTHSFSVSITKQATCGATGVKTYTCTACSYSYTETIAATGNHTYSSAVTKQATCGEDGVLTYTCSVCKNSYTESIAATGNHTYSGVTTTQPTCTQLGVVTYTCSGCSDSYTINIAALGHDYVTTVVAPTCTTDGYTKYDCTRCDEADYTDDIVASAGKHTYTGVVTKPATCSATGIKTYTCECGDFFRVVIAATGVHTYTDEVIAPTPDAQGYTKHTCTGCGDTYNDTYVDYVPEGTTTPVSDFEYTVADDGVTITKYNGTAAEVVIPSTIEGRPVIAIGSKAFYTNRTLKSVTLPATLKTVGADAFRGCTALATVVFNEGLETIGTYAFGLIKITTFTAPSTLKTIGVSAFNGCTALDNVDLSNVTAIKGSAFAGCKNLCLTAAAQRLLIPSTVKELGASAFLNCTSIKRVDWYPVKLTSGAAGSMEKPAFQGCTTINEVRIYETAVNIPTYAFYKSSDVANNLGIGTLSFRGTSSAQTIGDYAFFQQRIGKVVFPNTITKIGVESFRNNNMLKTLTFGTGEQTIGQLAFSFCNNLPSVTIPGNVKTIYAYAFRGCAKLETVVVEEGVDYISSYAFGFTALKSITLPASITRINSGLTYPTSATITYPAGTYVDTYLHSSAARITNETLVPIA